MIEKRMRRVVIELLKPIFAFAVENQACDGTPDVCTVAGWIELKVSKRPVRETTNVKITIRNAQRLWMRRWTRHGGRAWILTKMDETWFLHNAAWGCENLGQVNEIKLREHAHRIWEIKTPSSDDLINALTGRRLP